MKKYSRVLLLLYFAGFVVGIICSNLLVLKTGYQTSLLPVYFSASLGEKRNYNGLFAELLVKRGNFFIIGILCGLTPAGVPMAIISVIWFGFLAGSLAALFLLEYGMKGLGISLACFFPQAVFYVPGWLLFFFVVIQMSQKHWGKLKRERADYKAYFFFVSGAGMMILLGIWMESYVNQNVLQYILTKWI